MCDTAHTVFSVYMIGVYEGKPGENPWEEGRLGFNEGALILLFGLALPFVDCLILLDCVLWFCLDSDFHLRPLLEGHFLPLPIL